MAIHGTSTSDGASTQPSLFIDIHRTMSLYTSSYMSLRFLSIAFTAIVVLYGSLQAQVAWEPANNGLEGGWTNTSAWTFNEDGDIYAQIGAGVYTLKKGSQRWELAHDTLNSWSLIAAHDGVLLSGSRNILRSEDKGATWQSVLTANENISSFRMAPDGAIWGIAYATVYRTEDNGLTWTARALSDSMIGLELTFDKQGRALATSWGGVFRSENDGTTWEKIAPIISYYLHSVVLTSTGDLLAASSNCYRRSTDDGVTWTVVDSLPVTRLAVAPNGDIYAGVFNRHQDYPGATKHSGIYRSTDDGKTWTHSISLKPGLLAVGPDGGLWVSVGNSILHSSDNGANWHEAVDNIWGDEVYEIKSDRFGTLFATIGHDMWISDDLSAGTYYALYGSTDNGDSWSFLRDSLSSPELRFDSSGGVYVLADGVFFQDASLQRSSDRGQSWKEFTNSGYVQLSSNHNGVIAVSTFNHDNRQGVMIVSTDGGATWTQNESALYAFSVIVAPNDMIVISAYDNTNPTATQGLYRSTNFGRDWGQISDMPASDLSISPAGDIYVAGPYMQGSNARTLYRMNSDMKEMTVLLYSTKLGSWKYGGRDVLFLRGDSVSYRSTDRGNHWEPLSVSGSLLDVVTTLIQKDIYALFMDSTQQRSVYRSTDNGNTWTYVTEGIASRYLSSITDAGDQIFASTYGSGVYRTARPAGTPRTTFQERVALTLGHSTPNPFSTTTTIPFTLLHQQHVTLKVHDLLGGELAILADGVMSVGEKSVQWNATGMATGVYVVTLAGEKGSTSRLIVLQ
jgi:photosystem II stability/assembly factor-like uncharacterized protein